MINRIEEVKSFLSQANYSLAVRRMLDCCFDAGDETLLKQSILWSKQYNTAARNSNDELPENFLSEGYNLLEKLLAIADRKIYPSKVLLNAEHITKSYKRGNFSLHPMNLQINSGDILGVVGENGNGKTTLLRCLAGQLALDDGHIHYTQLMDPDYYAIKQHIAFIPQRIPKWYGLLKDNLHFAASLAGFKGKQNELLVDFMVERLNLSAYVDLTWNQISSGYRTRFEIARILLQKPSLLILDEPLANLDINAQQTLLTDLKYMAKSTIHPMGVILSSQQLHEVEKVADNVLLIKQGKCLFTMNESVAVSKSVVIEVETKATYTELENIFSSSAHIQFNGGFYTVTTDNATANEVIYQLLQAGITITYFRDITHSTKRFF